MWGIISQPSLWLAYLDHPVMGLEEQAWELESGSQAYKGGNVTVEDPTLSFSPYFSPSFSFDNSITCAFPDIAMDLDSFA